MSAAVISRSVDSSRDVSREAKAATPTVTASAIGRKIGSNSPTSTSRTATLTFASGTNAMIDRSSIPGRRPAATGARKRSITGKK